MRTSVGVAVPMWLLLAIVAYLAYRHLNRGRV